MNAIVTVKGKNPTPWDNGVRFTILGDHTDLINIISALEQVKAAVNADVNRAGMALKDVKVTIEMELQK